MIQKCQCFNFYRDLLEKYRTEVPSEVGSWDTNHDNIPEMHFPSSEEGAGQSVQMNECVKLRSTATS